MWRLLLLWLTLPYYPDALAQPVPAHSEADSTLAQGQALLAQKQYAQAARVVTKLIDEDPANWAAYLSRSKANYGLKDYQGTISDAAVILQHGSQVPPATLLAATLNVGIAYNSLNQFKQAIPYFKAAKRIDSTASESYYSLSYSYLALHELDSALTELGNWVTLHPQDERGHYGLGKVYYLKEQYRQAIAAFNQAIVLKPDYVMAYQNRGSAKHMIGDKAGCCQDWQKCLALGYAPIKELLREVCR